METQAKYRRLPAKKFTRDEKRNIILKWKSSGQSKAAFCQSIGLAKSAFYSWCIQFKHDLSDGETIFSPVTLKKVPTPNTQEFIQLEIWLPNQTKIVISMQKSSVISFIQELSYETTIIR